MSLSRLRFEKRNNSLPSTNATRIISLFLIACSLTHAKPASASQEERFDPEAFKRMLREGSDSGLTDRTQKYAQVRSAIQSRRSDYLVCQFENEVLIQSFYIFFSDVRHREDSGTALIWTGTANFTGNPPQGLTGSLPASYGGTPDDISLGLGDGTLTLHHTSWGMASELRDGLVSCTIQERAGLLLGPAG